MQQTTELQKRVHPDFKDLIILFNCKFKMITELGFFSNQYFS